LSPRHIADQLPISHEHLYQWIYRKIRDGYVWQKHLRSGRSSRVKRKSRLAAALACASHATPIAERPDYINNRRHFGHWEADLLLGRKDNSAAVLVVKERMSRLTLLAKVPRKDSVTVMRAMLKLMRPYLTAIHSVTTDNGKEFFNHQPFVKATGCKMFVCKPHSPWQRGQVEGENKNIRQYLPKSFNADRLTTKRLKAIERKLNMRPKRVLNNNNPLDTAFSLSGVALRY
jgi:IS30 family transposase